MMRPSTSTTTDAFRAPVYPPIPAGVHIIPTYSDGWVANTLPAIRPVTPNRGLPEKTMSLKDPKLGVGKHTTVSHTIHSWAPPQFPVEKELVGRWDPCNLSFQSYVELTSPRALLPGATSPRKMSSMKIADPVEFGHRSDPRFAATPSGIGYAAPPAERAVTAVVTFRHQQPAHSSGFKSNFNSGSLAQQFRQKWPAGAEGLSVSSRSFGDTAARDRRFPAAPFAPSPAGASNVSGYNSSLKHLGPAAALGAIAHTAPTEPKETVPKMKLNAGPGNTMPQGTEGKLAVTVRNPPHNSGFRSNFKADGVADQMRGKWPADTASVSAGTFVNQSGRNRGMPGVPYIRGPLHSSHISAYSRSLPLNPCIS